MPENNKTDHEKKLSELQQLRKRNKFLEEALAETEKSENDFKLLAEHSSDIIARFDRDHKFLYVNIPVMAISAEPLENFPGKNIHNLLFPDDFSDFLENRLTKVFTTGNILHDQFEVEAITGTFVYDMILIPEFNSLGKINSVIVHARDVTELIRTKKALAESEKKLFFHINQSPLAYIEWDKEFRVTEWNRLAESIFGYTKKETFKRKFYDRIIKEHQEVYENDLSFFDGTGRTVCETKYGKKILCEWYNALLFDNEGDITGMASLVEDITESGVNEEELHKSRQKLSFHFNENPLGCIEWNKDLIITDWNLSATKIFGYKPEETTGKAGINLLFENTETKRQILKQCANAATVREVFKFTCLNVNASGERITCEWYNAPVTDQQGAVTGFSSLVNDITERARAIEDLKKNEKKYMDLVETTGTGFFVVDFKGNIIDCNKEFAGLAGSSGPEELIGENVEAFLMENESKKFQEALEKCSGSSRIKNMDICLSGRDSKITSVEISMTAVTDCEKPRIMGLCKDISERKRMETEIIAARKKAEKADKAKGEFLANMSHEIRTPLNGVIGMSYLLAETNLTKEQQDYVESINNSAELLLAVIEDILDISKIEAGKLSVDRIPFNIRAKTDGIYEIIKYHAENKEIELNYEFNNETGNNNFKGDPAKLEQILVNLLSNAVKFTEAGYVKLSVNIKKYTGKASRAIFEISDTGIGIEKEKISTLFDKFTQADTSIKRKYGGTGLGLAICSKIIKLLGSSLQIQSEPGKGSIFRFELRLPFAGKSDISSETVSTYPQIKQDAMILLAEDNTINQKLFRKLLNKAGCRVILASNGKQAVEKFIPGKFDLVMMDVQMPIMDGFEATELIRKTEKGNARTPVIAVTAHAMTGDREKCMAAGMNDYISKPVRKSRIIEILEKYIPPDDGSD